MLKKTLGNSSIDVLDALRIPVDSMLDAHIGPKERPRLGSLVPIEDFKLSSCTPIFWQSRTITISTYLSLFGTWGVLILAVCGAADVEHL